MDKRAFSASIQHLEKMSVDELNDCADDLRRIAKIFWFIGLAFTIALVFGIELNSWTFAIVGFIGGLLTAFLLVGIDRLQIDLIVQLRIKDRGNL